MEGKTSCWEKDYQGSKKIDNGSEKNFQQIRKVDYRGAVKNTTAKHITNRKDQMSQVKKEGLNKINWNKKRKGTGKENKNNTEDKYKLDNKCKENKNKKDDKMDITSIEDRVARGGSGGAKAIGPNAPITKFILHC